MRDTTSAAPPPLYAVIDMGSTSIRMAIAEVSEGEAPRTIDEVQQPVAIGNDVFTRGRIGFETTEACVSALQRFRRLLDEFRIAPDHIRAVATSAVREASNRRAFLDRILIATGIQVEPIDEAEVNRLTYMNLAPMLRGASEVGEDRTLLVEIGGGTSDVLYLEEGRVAFSHTYRLGSLRMREMLEHFRAPVIRERRILETHITRTLKHLESEVDRCPNMALVAQGWDVRFAAKLLKPDWDEDGLKKLSVAKLSKLVDTLLARSVEELVERYQLSLEEAETVGPALLALTLLARQYKLRSVYVARTHFRDCLLREIAQGERWVSEYRTHILHSAHDLSQRYDVDDTHARHVAALGMQLFDALQEHHGMGAKERLLLEVSCLLHEAGMYVSQQAHHKHTQYLISHSEIFGLTQADTLKVSLVARYHRRGLPRTGNAGYNSLPPEDQVSVSKLAALIRTADALDRARTQRVHIDHVEQNGRECILYINHVDDLALEQYALEEKGPLFEHLFGMQPVLQKGAR